MGKSLLVKLGSVVLAIVVAIGIYFVKTKGEEKIEQAKAPKVGECLHVEGSFNAKHKEYKCDDLKATYKVVGDNGKCDEIETNYTISLGSGKDGNVADLCLDLNAAEGDCFEEVGTQQTKVECAANVGNTNVFKILKVAKSGETCAAPGQPVENVTRKVLYCVGENA